MRPLHLLFYLLFFDICIQWILKTIRNGSRGEPTNKDDNNSTEVIKLNGFYSAFQVLHWPRLLFQHLLISGSRYLRHLTTTEFHLLLPPRFCYLLIRLYELRWFFFLLVINICQYDVIQSTNRLRWILETRIKS